MSKLTIKHIPLKSRAKVGITGRRFKWMTPLSVCNVCTHHPTTTTSPTPLLESRNNSRRVAVTVAGRLRNWKRSSSNSNALTLNIASRVYFYLRFLFGISLVGFCVLGIWHFYYWYTTKWIQIEYETSLISNSITELDNWLQTHTG